MKQMSDLWSPSSALARLRSSLVPRLSFPSLAHASHLYPDRSIQLEPACGHRSCRRLGARKYLPVEEGFGRGDAAGDHDARERRGWRVLQELAGSRCVFDPSLLPFASFGSGMCPSALDVGVAKAESSCWAALQSRLTTPERSTDLSCSTSNSCSATLQPLQECRLGR